MINLKKAPLGAMVACVLAAPAMAVEFTGGEVTLGYSQFGQKVEGETLAATRLDAALEYAISQNYGIQGNLGFHDFKFARSQGAEIGKTFALHGLYHLNDSSSVGLFIGRDDVEALEVNFIGAEFGYEASTFEMEAFLTFGDSDDGDGESDNIMVIGLDGAAPLSNGFGVVGGLTLVDDGTDTSQLYEIGVSYELSDTLGLDARYGYSSDDASDDEDSGAGYIAFEVEYTFGAKRGATFGERGLLHLLPGL